MFLKRKISEVDAPKVGLSNDKLLPKLLDAIMKAAAEEAHEAWRKGFQYKNGKGAQRIKNGEDINQPFHQLKNKKNTEENILSVQVATYCILLNYSKQASGDLIHNQWLKRNKDWATEQQKLHFSKLPEEEQNKDLEIYYIVKKHFNNLFSQLELYKEMSFETWMSHNDKPLSAWLDAIMKAAAEEAHEAWRKGFQNKDLEIYYIVKKHFNNLFSQLELYKEMSFETWMSHNDSAS